MPMRLFETQQALYQRLCNAIGTKTFDCLPEKTELPYIVLGEIEYTPELTKTSKGTKIIQTLYIYSKSRGKKETFDIINEIENALQEELDISQSELLWQKITSIEVLEVETDQAAPSTIFQGTIKVEILLDVLL